MGGDPGDDIRKPRLRVDAVHFCRDYQAVHRRGTVATTV
ncbi:hypothetical protein ABID59_002136 [Bradyrhizobium sp. S3.3.6]